MTDEGQKAIEAAALASCSTMHHVVCSKACEVCIEDTKAVIRAYFTALPGWRLVPGNILWAANLEDPFPPPPGLEPDSHE